jgi:hypothetical protein
MNKACDWRRKERREKRWWKGRRRFAWRGGGATMPCDIRSRERKTRHLRTSQGLGWSRLARPSQTSRGAGFGFSRTSHLEGGLVWCELRKRKGVARFMRASQGVHGIKAGPCELRTGWVGSSGGLGLRFSGSQQCIGRFRVSES